jgi:hypothetical protein
VRQSVAGTDMSMKAEESLLLGTTTKQWACENTAAWEALVCAIVICIVCELVIML